MDAPRGKIILSFDVTDAPTRRNVRETLARLSLSSKDRLDRHMASGKIVLKRHPDPAVDRRIVAMMEAAGAVCRFESASGEKQTPPHRPAQNAPVTPAGDEAQPSALVCPQCQRPRHAAPECRYCGIIFNKYRARPMKSTAKANHPPNGTHGRPDAAGAKVSARNQVTSKLKQFGNWMAVQSAKGSSAQQWSQRLGDNLAHCGVAFVLAFILEVCLLYLGNWIWIVYTATHVGQTFLSMGGELAQSLQHLFQANLALLAWQVVITALLVHLVVGAAGQFSHFIRYFHSPLGLMSQLIVWGTPISGVAAWAITRGNTGITFVVAYAVVLPPAVLMMNRCFSLMQSFIPEMGSMAGAGHRSIGVLGKLTRDLAKKLTAKNG
ncbi:MAG: hypothetical protein HKP58_18495 [Desulfatitalea sp.]|nr:hypothetical protein [Desulfatitalea sp.]NNK02407.1 hypothetical protein [Desulfatitalea sp.]